MVITCLRAKYGGLFRRRHHYKYDENDVHTLTILAMKESPKSEH